MSRTQAISRARHDAAETHPRRTQGKRLFLGFLMCVGSVYGVVVIYHLTVPRRLPDAPQSLLDRCREACLSYGLIPTGHLAKDAESYLAVAKPQDLSSSLAEILADDEFVVASSQPHPLFGITAPDFQLRNDRGEPVALREMTARGPVVVVFYYGYGCSHCVAQLFGLQKDLNYLRELGAEVVALSGDSPEHTAEKFAEYGRFDFPVVSDAGNKVAERYGVYVPASSDRPDDLKHGTFLIDRSGTVVFAQLGYQPFLDNKSLLFWLADKRPATAVARQMRQAETTGETP